MLFCLRFPWPDLVFGDSTVLQVPYLPFLVLHPALLSLTHFYTAFFTV